jgi:hypothetical protein
MSYKHNVFLSYKNHDVTNFWVTKFVEKLSYWLTQELGGDPALVFFDKDIIETGEQWPQRLKDGIKTSKCLVGIWTPEYFRSKWCLSEWRSFEERERILREEGIQQLTHPLIRPLRFHDGEHYPGQAQERQLLDVTNYTSTNMAFWETAKAIELEDKIKDLCKGLAETIRFAPEFNPDFPLCIIEDDPEPPANTRQKL